MSDISADQIEKAFPEIWEEAFHYYGDEAGALAFLQSPLGEKPSYLEGLQTGQYSKDHMLDIIRALQVGNTAKPIYEVLSHG